MIWFIIVLISLSVMSISSFLLFFSEITDLKQDIANLEAEIRGQGYIKGNELKGVKMS